MRLAESKEMRLKAHSWSVSGIFAFVLFLGAPASASSYQCAKSYTDSEIFVQVQEPAIHSQPSVALRDPLIEEARVLSVVDDFKMLSDLSPRLLTAERKAQIEKRSVQIEKQKDRKTAVRFLIKSLYEHKQELLPVDLPELKAKWTIKNEKHAKTFEHTEKMWSVLTRKTPAQTSSSLIPLPHPLLIPGARFQEGYYWDSYFAFPALLSTGRRSLVQGQIQNFLYLVKNYGLVPNGTRDYYLSRSQPPLLSQMVRLLVEHEIRQFGKIKPSTLRWLRSEAYPLIKRDYAKFWMNPKTRYDAKTGLNRHYDSENTPRPERHSSDQEEAIGNTYRDVRAEAESGKDFTDAFDGEASNYAGVMLNSILYSVEKDLSWLAHTLEKPAESRQFLSAAHKRQKAMNTYLWDAKTGVYRDYNLRTGLASTIVTADTFAPLHAQLATPEQAQKVAENLYRLERAGGLMSSEKNSGKQWDAPYGWAPHHYFAIDGLRKYGFHTDAHRLAQKWVETVDRIFQRTGKIIEKIDATTGDVPIENGDKYPTQDGFLWTNGVYVWALTDVLKVELEPR